MHYFRSNAFIRTSAILFFVNIFWSSLELDLVQFTIWLINLMALTTTTRIPFNQMFVNDQTLVELPPPTLQPVLFFKFRVLLFSECSIPLL